MKLPMVVSPATWDLIERLRPDLDVAVDVFDTSLAPLLPESSQDWAVRLRQAAENREPDGGRDRLLSAVRTGRHLLFSDQGLRIGLFPVRYHREVAGVLAVAIAERRTLPAADEAPEVEGPRVSPEGIDRRIERIGWSLRAAIEADIALWEKLDQAEHRARWSDSTLHFLEYLHTCGSDVELFTAVVQAAAVWGDVDARVYRRTLNDCYVLDASLPFREGDAPAAFDAALVDGRGTPARIASIAELELLGWRGGVGEVVLMPVGPAGQPPMWLLALAGTADERLASVFGTLARTLSVRVEQLMLARAADIAARLHVRLLAPQSSVPAAAAVLLKELLTALPAAQARLLAHDPATGSRRLLASVGGTLFGLHPGPAPMGELQLSPERLLVPLEIGAGAPAVLDVWASLGAPFSAADAFVAREVAKWIEAWLAGAWRGLATGAALPFGERERFEARLEEELERARRYRYETGLLVVAVGRGPEAGRSPEAGRDLLTGASAEAVRSQLRSTDLLGELSDGRLAALLVQADAAVVDAVASRIQQHLRALPRQGGEPPAALGRAAFPSAGETLADLLAAAEHDLARRFPPSTELAIGR
jgi:GGDEF domain-containing protein